MVSASCVLQFVTFLSSLLGIALATLGGYMHQNQFGYISLSVMILGGVIFVVSLFGFLGANYEKNWMLLIYFYIIFVVSITLMLFVVGVMLFQAETHSALEAQYTTLSQDEAFINGNSGYDNLTKEQFIEKLKTDHEQNLQYVAGVGGLAIFCMVVGLFSSLKILTLPIIMKNLLAVINAVYICIGAALAGAGAFLANEYKETPELPGAILSYILLGVGVVIIILAFIGLYGSVKRNRTFLACYACMTFLVLVILVGVGAYAFHAGGQVEAQIEALPEQDFQDSIEKTPLKGFSKADASAAIKSNLQFVGLGAFIVCLFLFVGFIGAVTLRKSLVAYASGSI